MACTTVQTAHAEPIWKLVRRQHGVVSRRQLLNRGFSRAAIAHRIRCGRLHRVHPGVYAVGRPQLPRLGELMAAVLAGGRDALLSHNSAAEVLGAVPSGTPIHVTVPTSRAPRLSGIVFHRRKVGEAERGTCRGIPVTSPARTLCDLACRLPPEQLARAVDEADKLDLIDPEALRDELGGMRGRPGVARLRALLDRHTFALTDSELERRFVPIARAAGLPLPLTRQRLNGFRVDFHWPELGLVVETDGLRYHRTAAAQARALHRDHTHFRSGLIPLRFSHYQVVFESDEVRAALEEGLRRCISRA